MTTTTSHPLSPESFESHVPHGFFAELRDNDPVHWTDGIDDSQGFWSVTRRRDVVDASRDTDTFSSQLGGTTTEDVTSADLEARRSLIDTDPPVHTAMRKLLTSRFTAGAVRRDWTEFIDDLVATTLDDALGRGSFDFVDTVASVIPIVVLGELLGVPREDQQYLMKLGDEMIASGDPDHAPRTASSPQIIADNSGYPFSSPAGRELWEYAGQLRRRRMLEPGPDVFSLLVGGQLPDRALTAQELDNFFSLLVIAGNETTRMALCHGLLAFLAHPEQLDALAANPDLAASATEEILRWATPVHHFRRTATTDTVLAGRSIKAGDKVVLWYVSANHDERAFVDPHRFNIERRPNAHIAFGGGGPHFCIGGALARLEVRAVFTHLAARSARLALDGDVVRLRSNLTHGIKKLPVRVETISKEAS